NHPGLAGFFGAGPESFRVVDLERAQGLVRDHVIFSPGFGRTPHGRALHSFGPLSAEGGREKFALAMTRARRSMHVLTCFRPEDLDHTRLTHGAVDLYALLNREISGNTDLGTPASRAAASEQALGADPLVADLGDRLRARGARVWHQYDGAIDVVAAADPLSTMGRDDADLPWPVAIESDGTEQYRTMSVRERSRLRPQLLERLGWRYMPLWTIEVFTDPSACADRIAGYLGLENLALPGRAATSGGFLDDDVDQALNGIDTRSAGASYLSRQNARHHAGQNTAGQTGHRSADLSAPGQVGASEGHATARGNLDNSAAAAGPDGREAGRTAEDRMPGERMPQEDASHEDMTQEEPSPEGTLQEDMQQEEKNQGAAPEAAKPAGTTSPADVRAPGGILPTKAAEDDARSWGDRDEDHDAWLKEQKPPHWG
ncbi:MAG: AAA family ATPase, partial [Pseudarthrobacter sp.]|nr:AAA family ATPase [Pseudarthrobacter sp.]